jgi:hypothetical protein
MKIRFSGRSNQPSSSRIYTLCNSAAYHFYMLSTFKLLMVRGEESTLRGENGAIVSFPLFFSAPLKKGAPLKKLREP